MKKKSKVMGRPRVPESKKRNNPLQIGVPDSQLKKLTKLDPRGRPAMAARVILDRELGE